MLDKKGNSNTRERCELWNQFLEIFGDRKIDFLTADREFVGEDWFDYLLCDHVRLFVSAFVKTPCLTMDKKNCELTFVFKIFKLVNRKCCLNPERYGAIGFVSPLRLKDGDLLIVATAHDPDTAISDYAKRWAIESLFGCFKTRGFCLESTHLQDSQRLSKLIALLTLALCWAFSSGLTNCK